MNLCEADKHTATLASVNMEHLILLEERRGKEEITVNSLIKLRWLVSLRQSREDNFWSSSSQKPLRSPQIAALLLSLNQSHEGRSCRDSWSEEFAFLPCVFSCCSLQPVMTRCCKLLGKWRPGVAPIIDPELTSHAISLLNCVNAYTFGRDLKSTQCQKQWWEFFFNYSLRNTGIK